MDWPQSVLETIYRQVAQYGRTGATKIYTVPDVSALAVGAPVTTSTPQTVPFREDGVVIAIYGQEVTGTAAKFATTQARIQIGGSEDIFTDGSSGSYVSFLSLFGGAQNWFPILRRVNRGVQWTITYRNVDTGATATPSLQFAFIADNDIANMAK